MLTTCSSDTAMRLYENAINQLQSHTADPFQSAEAAILEDPNFVMAHCLRAYSGTAMAEAMDSEHLRKLLSDARSSAAGCANEREKLHIAAIESWLAGDLPRMSKLFDEILLSFPLDFLALQRGHLIDFHTGSRAKMRDRVASALPHYQCGIPDLGYVLGMHAFGLEENSEYEQAEQAGRDALEVNSDDVWAIHAVAHVMEMQGRHEDGVKWYNRHRQQWAVENNFSVHNWWHVALFHLSLGNYKEVLEIHDEYLASGSMELDCVDSSSLLWRLYLKGFDVGSRWQKLADKWENLIENRDFYCFNDYHALLAFLAAQRWNKAVEITGRAKKYAQRSTFLGQLANEVGLPIFKGLTDFTQERYDCAVENLSAVRDRIHRSGGSFVQRNVLTLTLTEAAKRSGRNQVMQDAFNNSRSHPKKTGVQN